MTWKVARSGVSMSRSVMARIQSVRSFQAYPTRLSESDGPKLMAKEEDGQAAVSACGVRTASTEAARRDKTEIEGNILRRFCCVCFTELLETLDNRSSFRTAQAGLC